MDQDRRRGYREIRLDTLPDMTEAIGLYRRAGFVPIPAYYVSPVAGTVFLGCSLAAAPDGRHGSGSA
jgi:ribosomal protein S18 acetylase RimI-like enzyme